MPDNRIQRIIDLVSNVNPGQIAIEPVADPDLGNILAGYKDAAGNVHKHLNKDEAARVEYLDIIQNGHACVPGRLCYDSATNGLTFGLSTSVSLNVGEEFLFRARNNEGSEITNGQVVYLSGAQGTNPLIALADKDTTDAYDVLGVATEDIADSGFGYTTAAGHVRGIDMSAFTTGDELWLGDDGAMQSTQPNAPAASVYMGIVLDDHATQGEMLARVRPIPKLWELSDVDRSVVLSDGDAYRWVAANNRFELSTLLTAADVVTSLDVEGAAGGALQGDLKFYTSAGVFIDKAADGFIFSALFADTIYLADSVSLVEGTYVSGDVDDTHTINLVGYVLDETAGSPGYDLRLNYSSVNGIDKIQAHILYDAVSGHTVAIQLYNYNTTSFDTFTTFTTSVGYQTFDVPVADDTNYIDGSGNAVLRFYHAASGLASHELTHDYAVLVESTGGGGGGQAVLAQRAIGFGDSSNELTGDATNFFYDSSIRQMQLGAGTPAYITTDTDSLYTAGQVEFSNDAHFAGGALFHSTVRVDDDRLFTLGDSSDAQLEFDTAQTNDALALWLPNATKSLMVSTVAGQGTDYGLGLYTMPTVVILSETASTDANQRIEFAHTGSDALYRTYEGSHQYSDAYLIASTNWAGDRIRLFDSTAEVDSLYALLSNAEGSIAAAIIAASQVGGGGSLDDAYNNGATITVDDTRVGFIVPASATNGAVDIANNEATNSSDLVTLYNAGDGHTFDMNGDMWSYASGKNTMQAIGDAEITSQSAIILTSGVGTGGGIQMYGFTEGIDITGICHGAAQYLGFSATSLAGFNLGVIDLDFATGSDKRYVNATQDVTEIAVVDPIATGDFYLRITASGGTRTVANLTSSTSTPFTFIGNYDLNTESVAIASGDTLVLKMIFHGTSLGWDVQAVTEV